MMVCLSVPAFDGELKQEVEKLGNA